MWLGFAPLWKLHALPQRVIASGIEYGHIRPPPAHVLGPEALLLVLQVHTVL